MNRRIVKVDTSTGERLGDATDCITVLDDAADGNGIKLIGTAFFKFPNGTIVTRGNTSVRPKISEFGSDPVTHSTMAVPNPGENGVLSATGIFEGLEASVRLSGAVDLSRLGSNTEITFDCLWDIRPL